MRGEQGRLWGFRKHLIRLFALSQKLTMRNNTDILQYPGMLLSPARLVSQCLQPSAWTSFPPGLASPPFSPPEAGQAMALHAISCRGFSARERSLHAERPRAVNAKTPTRRTPGSGCWAPLPCPPYPHRRRPPPGGATAPRSSGSAGTRTGGGALKGRGSFPAGDRLGLGGCSLAEELPCLRSCLGNEHERNAACKFFPTLIKLLMSEN